MTSELRPPCDGHAADRAGSWSWRSAGRDVGVDRRGPRLACPSSTWIVRRSVPASSRCVAKLCRSVCGVTCLPRPAALVRVDAGPLHGARRDVAALATPGKELVLGRAAHQ